MRKPIKYFETYFDSMKNLKDHFYLVTPLNKDSLIKICNLEPGPPLVCTNIFGKYWTQSHYLTGAESYFYKEENLSDKELYLKNHSAVFGKVNLYPLVGGYQIKGEEKNLR